MMRHDALLARSRPMQEALPKCEDEVDDEESERAFRVKKKHETAFEPGVVDENRREVQNAESSEEK